MKKLTNKALKEMMKTIEDQLNTHEPWDEEFWTYKLEIKKDVIQVKIYDGEWCEYVLQVPVADNITDILKGCISYLYENELNHRQTFLKANKGFYNRKHKSLNTWFERQNQIRIDSIVEDIATRYSVSKKVESEISHYKNFVSDFYCCLSRIIPNWKTAEIKEATFKKIQEFNINNVGVSYIDNTIIVMKSDDKAEKILDKFDIVVDSYSNTNMIVNQVINRLRKVA